ncbi:hypothetical protein [Alkalicoccobacillus plakortidis]|uniref:Uncharacterized protein n=1 Tax=Alkalicoccobacillus plakortidis TaxID=444060 RepID=A0ABT0XGM7_9BACI|nr:hypothetical protein [Alkalicoccobacillus plakortidis]MCM2674352.1 hypothetical protein [Alkalicoccobacillus plakortidis]
MRKTISLLAILFINCITLALGIMLVIAKWGVIDKQTGMIVLSSCFVLGIWNAISFIDVCISTRRNR